MGVMNVMEIGEEATLLPPLHGYQCSWRLTSLLFCPGTWPSASSPQARSSDMPCLTLCNAGSRPELGLADYLQGS